MAYDETTAARVRRILASRRDVQETPLMGGLCFMVAGSMCCSVSGKGGLLVRVDPGDFEEVLTEPHVKPMRMGRRTMRGFVRVESEGYRADPALERWVRRGVAVAMARSRTSPPGGKRKRRSPSKTLGGDTSAG